MKLIILTEKKLSHYVPGENQRTTYNKVYVNVERITQIADNEIFIDNGCIDVKETASEIIEKIKAVEDVKGC